MISELSPAVGSSPSTEADWLGVSVSVNGHAMEQAVVNVPALSSGCPPLCEGCGETKLYRGREATSLVCCSSCWSKLPKWMRDAFATDCRRPAVADPHGASIWENRIAVALMWMKEARQATAAHE